MINKITKYLGSLRFTLLIICLLGFMFLLGLWIPQKSLVKEWYFQWKTNAPGLVAFLDALQLTDIYTSPITLTLWVFFFVNLALVMWQRLPLIKKRIALTESKIIDPSAAGSYSFKSSYPLPAGMDGAAVISYLRSRGYAILETGQRFYGVKNRYSPIAFALFHLSFFLILLGGLVSIYTQFYGYLDLAEGETFQGEIERYVKNPMPSMPKIGSPPRVVFTLQSILPVASGFTETGLKVRLVDGREKVHNLDINKPYITDSTNFVLKNLGVAPLFVFKDPSGKEIDGAYIKLNVLKGAVDRFTMGGYEFRLKCYPDYVLQDGLPATRSLEFNNPTFSVVVSKEGQTVAEGMLPRNGVLAFSGNQLEMREMRYWVRFSVIKELGVPIIYAGFAIASLAIIWRLLMFRREIVGVVRNDAGENLLEVAANSEYYKSLAEDEFNKLFEDLFAGSGRKIT
jgi:hypothetical protein